MKNHWLQDLGHFLAEQRQVAYLFLACVGLFALVFFLYGLPMEPLLYAFFLYLLFCIILEGVWFVRWRTRHKARQTILQNLPLLTSSLPDAKTQGEADLNTMVLQLTHVLETERTEQSTCQQEMLDYYTTWVHQIKTPISVMKLQLENEDTAENRKLSTELFRIEQYVEMVLSYLRLGSPQSDYLFQEYALDSIIKQAIHKYAPLFIQQRIRFVYSPTDVKVLTDEKWLLFILEQILSNSAKYTPPCGTVTITVTPDKILQIADTGIGIAPEDLPRIFEKGFTGYNGRTNKKASGLGLYLCRTAAQRLGHRIWAKSEPGKGTSILLDLSVTPLGVE